jgi:hypothetical protein
MNASKKILMAKWILLFDFELFIGGLVGKSRGWQLMLATNPCQPVECFACVVPF